MLNIYEKILIPYRGMYVHKHVKGMVQHCQHYNF